MLYISNAERADALWVAARLREADRQEVYAATGQSPVVVLPQSFDISDRCYTIRADDADGEPLGIFGVGGGGTRRGLHIGIPWLLGTDELVNAHARSLIRVSRPWVAKLGEHYDVLANLVYAENKVHIRWLEWCGFTLGKHPVKHGPFDQPFFPFVKDTR